MSVIKAILFSYLRSEAHYEFLVVFLNLLDKFSGVKQLVFALVLKFSGLLEVEKKLVAPARKSPFSLPF
ncbi:MAG: hypothetical protein LBT78_06820 [Tannerella sp.]|jgi:hypothetical protein|nr:hypothetical protein [Tannerella sp.]